MTISLQLSVSNTNTIYSVLPELLDLHSSTKSLLLYTKTEEKRSPTQQRPAMFIYNSDKQESGMHNISLSLCCCFHSFGKVEIAPEIYIDIIVLTFTDFMFESIVHGLQD